MKGRFASPVVWSDDQKTDSNRYRSAMTRVMQQKQIHQFRSVVHFAKASNAIKTQYTMKTLSTIESPGVPAFECSFNTLLQTFLGWEQKGP